LSSRNGLLLTAAPTFHGRTAFAAMRTAAQWAAMQRIPKGSAMAKATHTAIWALCYFLAPFAVFVGLVAIGTFTANLTATNLEIDALVLCGLFGGLILALVRKYRINALMLICSVSLIAVYLWHFGPPLSSEAPLQRYLYKAEILLTPDFDKKCIPPNGILFGGDTLRICSTYDFNLVGFVDLIVKISGSYPEDSLIDDINSRKVNPAVDVDELIRLGGMWPNSVTGQHLVSDYYLIKVHICGNARPYC
jgi:hypothetical protein